MLDVRLENQAFVNVATEPVFDHLDDDQALLSTWNDPLDYSGYHYNLVCAIDMRTGGSVRRLHGVAGLNEALELAARATAEPTWHCVGIQHRRLIELRLTELAGDLRSRVAEQPDGHHLYAVAGKVYCLCPPELGVGRDFSCVEEARQHAGAAAVSVDPGSRVLRLSGLSQPVAAAADSMGGCILGG